MPGLERRRGADEHIVAASLPLLRIPSPAPPRVYAALWFGALLAAAGELPDPFPPPLEELARRYFERYPPEVKA